MILLIHCLFEFKNSRFSTSSCKGLLFPKLPFLGGTSFQNQKKLQELFSYKLTSCNLKIAFTAPFRVKDFLTFIDKLMLLSGLAYKCKCNGYNTTYYNKTKRHFKVRICEHLGISHLISKKENINNNKLTAIQEHLFCCNYSLSFEDFFFLR